MMTNTWNYRLSLYFQTDQQMDCALDLMRRLPPQQIEKNLTDLIDLVPSMCDDLLSSVDQPLKIAQDKTNGKDYLLCDYNRDGDSYRSPWSNTYDPPLEDGSMPTERLRKLEMDANLAFDQYREMYFEGGVSSVYLWDMDHGFAGMYSVRYFDWVVVLCWSCYRKQSMLLEKTSIQEKFPISRINRFVFYIFPKNAIVTIQA